jgi:hypothetical protein
VLGKEKWMRKIVFIALLAAFASAATFPILEKVLGPTAAYAQEDPGNQGDDDDQGDNDSQ